MENPIAAIIAKVPISDSGIVTTGISTERGEPRKANTTSETMPSASASVIATSRIEMRMKSPASLSTTMCIAGGICARISPIFCFSAADTVSAFAAGVGWMSM